MNKLEQFKHWMHQYDLLMEKPMSEESVCHFRCRILVRCEIIALLPYVASEIEFWCLAIPSEFLKAEYLFPLNTI